MQENNEEKKLLNAIKKFIYDMGKIKDIADTSNEQEALREICKLLKIGKIEVNLTVNRSVPYNTLDSDLEYEVFKDEYNPKNVKKISRSTEEGNKVEYTIYSTKDCKEWTKEELENIEAFFLVLYVYHGQMRIKRLIAKLMYEEVQFGMHNLAYFMKKISDLCRTGKTKDYVGVRLDIKGLGTLNKKYSKPEADRILFEYIKILQNTVGENGVVSRLGGDNFVLLLKKENLEEILNCLNGVPIKTKSIIDENVKVSATAGISYLEMCHSPYEIMDKMNSAYRKAKENKSKKTSNIVFYNKSLQEEEDKRRWFQDNFEEALKNGEIIPFYQPKVDSETNTLVGAEALCRWRHDGEILPTGAFIPIAEENGSIRIIDFVVFENVCKDIRRWINNGITPVRISVNFSRLHIGDEELINKILTIMDKHQVPHDLIEIELTETVTDIDFDELHNLVDQLHEKGIHAAVDDFGVGYSSLNLISDLPWDVLKIDKKFLPSENDENWEKKQKMLNYIIKMAKELNLDCIAEGVETQEQIDFLRERDCRKIQGYFYDKPLPIREFERRLKNPVYNGDNENKSKTYIKK